MYFCCLFLEPNMQYQIFKPSNALKSFVHFYWILEKFDKIDNNEFCQRIVPNGFVELTINYGEPANVLKQNKIKKLPQVHVAGQVSEYFDISTSCNTGFITVLIKPQAARFFFNFPLNELADFHVNLSDFRQTENEVLTEAIALAPTPEKKIEVVEKFLL